MIKPIHVSVAMPIVELRRFALQNQGVDPSWVQATQYNRHRIIKKAFVLSHCNYTLAYQVPSCSQWSLMCKAEKKLRKNRTSRFSMIFSLPGGWFDTSWKPSKTYTSSPHPQEITRARSCKGAFFFHQNCCVFWYMFISEMNFFIWVKTCKFTWKSGKFLWSFWRVMKISMGISRCFEFRCKFRTAEASDWMAFFLHLGGKYSWKWRRRTQAVMTQWGGGGSDCLDCLISKWSLPKWWMIRWSFLGFSNKKASKHFSVCLRVIIVVDLSKKLKKTGETLGDSH